MTHRNQRSSGVRMVKDATIKLKMMNLVHPLNAHWAYMWNTGWSTSRMTTLINFAASCGANCIKTAGSGIPNDPAVNPAFTDNFPSDDVFRSRIQWFCQQLRSRNMALYWSLTAAFECFGVAGNMGSVNLPIVGKILSWLHEDAADILCGIDLCNEWNGASYQPTTWMGGSAGYNQSISDMQQLFAVARKRTDVPLTCSAYVNEARYLGTSSGITGQYQLGADFCDYHPYYQNSSYVQVANGGPVPASADCAILEANPYYVGRHLMGECGVALSAGPLLQTQWYQGLGSMAQRSQSHGASAFCITDFASGGSQEYGLCDSNGNNPRSQLITPFEAWPGWL